MYDWHPRIEGLERTMTKLRPIGVVTALAFPLFVTAIVVRGFAPPVSTFRNNGIDTPRRVVDFIPSHRTIIAGCRRPTSTTTSVMMSLQREREEGTDSSSGRKMTVSNKLLAETIAPFRGLRLFFYGAFASGAFAGGLITLSGAIAAWNGLRPDIDVHEAYKNLAIDFGAVAFFGVFAKLDLDKGAELNAAVEEKVRRKVELKTVAEAMRMRELLLRDLNVNVRVSTDGATKMAPIGIVQTSAKQHVILVAGPGRAVRDALRGAQLNKSNFAMTNILVVPYETGGRVNDVVDRMMRPDADKGFRSGDTTSLLRPSYETQPYVAMPVGDGWEDFIAAEFDAAVGQAGENVRDEGIALVVANDGRVLRRGVGKVPWRQMVDELEEASTGEKKKETSVPFLEYLEE